MNYYRCICGGIVVLSMVSGIYECIKCGQHCEHQPHVPHNKASLISTVNVRSVQVSASMTTASGSEYLSRRQL